ncbi:MAG: hypothetical protein JXR77_07260, partial [Lentisphaeria bacterium]|nr:hypothetical protein [Lentisphaeria bacterium]
EVLDVREERFGFRELWAEGPDFFLNGVKRHLLATSTWPSSGPQTREEVRRNLEAIKAGNNVAFRLHTQPWQEQWLEEADEVGLMIVEEGALWCDGSGSYGYNDERFWDNTWVHLAGMVRRDRNHASLVMWSLENEILHCGAGRYADDVEERLAELGRRVRELDPSHLITYEADLDPGGVADVIGLHYPHEMPANHDYPNTADWLDRQVETGVDGGLLGSRRKGFRWDRRKPLYVGEYLWVPYQDFSPGSVFFGDEAYEDRTEYHRRSQAEAWRHQTLAYRRSGVSATCPWTAFGSGGAVGPRLLYDTQAEVYEPLAAYLHDLDCRFFAGEAVRRMFDVFNDSVFEQEVALAWSLEGTASSGTVPLRLSPADYQPVEVTVAMPAVEEPREFVLGWELRRGGEAVHRGRRTVRVYPRHSLRAPAGIRLLAYDPAGEWSRRAAADGLSLVAVASLGDLERLDPHGTVLVVAPDAFRPAVASGGIPRVGEERSDGSTLIGFLGRGGRALVLEQSTYDGIPLGVSLLDHASTLTFLQAADHPLFDGLEADDGMFWRGDHYVSRREFRRPTAGGIRALLVSGGERCLDQSPLLEVPAGAGSALLVQALVGTKMSTEPAARRILQNALDVLAVERPPRPRTVVLSADAAFRAALGRLRIDAEFLSVPPGPADLADAGLVILHGGGEGIAASSASLRSYLEASGSATVYWHAPDEGTFARVSGPLGASGFRVQSSAGPVTVRPRLVEVFPGLCREDLMFAGSASGGESWKRPFAADPAVIDRALLPVASVGGTTRIEAESMALEGRYVSVTADGTGVTFATVGTGTFSFAAAEAGLYPVVVHAGGTPAAGVFPLVVLRHGNETLAQISLTQGEQKAYPSMVELPAGVCELRLAYTNDLQADGEDRNLVLDAIQIGHRPLEHAAAELLTLPPAVALLPCGRGRLVVDCVRWDRNPRNETKARRYASALLAGLGASFAPPVPEPSWVPAAAFELEGSSGHFEKTGTELRYRSQGVCRAAFECVRAGSYEVVLRGWSNEVQGVYGRANVVVDGRAVGEVEVASTSSQTFAVGRLDALGTGTHTVEVTFTNDIWEPPLDRNLTVEAVGFRAAVVR